MESPPSLSPEEQREDARPYLGRVLRSKPNYLAVEAANYSLGSAGEEFVVRYERARLIREGKHRLAARVEHVSSTQGDGLGFDVLSFEASGRERLIEVKTTAYGKETPFFLTRNEVEISRERADLYHLYRLFRFRTAPRMFALNGALDKTCSIAPVQYVAQSR